ncbi:hypothetical protein MCAP1_001467 [Malassezia caprae]|uniref:RRM domain-containing protein n=1 Tax=Malassezia caprae TaxID=1381934 RepID=A0AAF0E6N2_9BASI|nr:hypothetical protein MCAP1_001467 [Malassezia caprae]
MATGDGGDVLVKRLHISGLTPNFSHDALRERLESYGRVLDLVGCDDSFTNGVGQRRPYAFATLETTRAQLSRCLNTLSGAIWKGAKLRVGEARPLWHERLEKERTAAHAEALRAKEVDRRKRWLRKRPWIGREATDMEPVTLQRVQDGEWGWKVTPAGHLVRPMHMRWTRPLPRPADAHPPSHHPHALRRAPCTTIDPTRYHREHLSGPMFDAMATDMASRQWSWDEDAHVWRAYEDGVCVSTEAPPPSRAPPVVEYTEAEPLPPTPARLDTEAEDELPDTLFEAEAPPEELFDAPPTSRAWWDEDEGAESQAPPPAHDPTPSPPPRNDPGLFDLSDFSDGYEETDHAMPAETADERARALHVLDHLFGQDLAPSPAPAAASMDEAPEPATEPPREEAPEPIDTDPDVHMASLKSMFQPAEETGGFTLFGDLGEDVELDPEMDEAVTGSAADAAPVPAPEVRAPVAPRTTSRLPPLTTPHTLATGEPSLIPALLQLGSSPFWKVSTDDEIEAAWVSKRAELTQTYRRLHREGIKKRRRRVVGARAATAAGGLAPARGARPPA